MSKVESLFLEERPSFLDLVEYFGSHKKLKSNQELYKAGDQADNLYVVNKGLLISRREEGNARVIDTIAHPGSLIGFESLESHPEEPEIYASMAFAPIESEVIGIPASTIQEIMSKFPHTAFDLLQLLAQQNRSQAQLHTRFTDTSQNKTTIMHILKSTEELMGEHMTVPVNQSDQAGRVGIGRQELSRWLGRYPNIPRKIRLNKGKRK